MSNNYGPDSGYYHSMDREYNAEALMPLREIGVSIMATKDAIQPLIAKIREGASKVEIGFMGRGKGSIFGGQITPESVDSQQREAIRQLAKVNRVDLSTHATVATGGFAGLGQRGFDEAVRQDNINEIKRAVDFAADTAEGGAVTLHADEFPRPLFDIEKRDDVEFLAHPHEKEQASFYLVDSETGDIIKSVQKNVPLHLPVTEKDDDGKEILDEFKQPIPIYDPEKKEFKLEKVEWDKIVELTEKHNENNPDDQLTPEKMYYKKQVQSKMQQLQGERLWHMQDYKHLTEQKERIAQDVKMHKKLESGMTEEQQEEYKKSYSDSEGLIRPIRKLPSERLDEELSKIKHQLARIQQSAVSYQEQLQDYEEQMDRIVPIKEYAVEKSADSIAQAGAYAYEIEQEKGLNQDGKKPLFISPENLFPEKYGSHPQELKELIMKSRERMAEMLKQEHPGLSSSKAKHIAQDHIKATIDVGHLNTWRKFFQKEEGESISDANDRFKDWLLDQMDDLNENKIVGHLHITDNFGYHDEHLTPGMGSAPIKEFVEKMKKAGVRDMVVEPGAQDPAKQYEALYGGWKLFGHSIYGISAPGKKKLDWGAVEHSYFGQNNPPYFLFGEMALSEEYRGSPFWTGLGLE